MTHSTRPHTTRVLFVTGTDTGAGKTLLTALLLYHLREAGVRALAMKPFCSGGTADVELLSAVQDEELPMQMLNPYYFKEPIAPLIAARKQRRRIELAEVVGRIREVQKRCDYLIIEGSGGLLVPLGEGYSVLDLIKELGCSVIVAARNRLGVINHTLMTVKIIQSIGIKDNRIVLLGCKHGDISAQSNRKTLRELLSSNAVYELPYLGAGSSRIRSVKRNHKKIKKTLALILGADKLWHVHCEHAVKSG